MDQKTRFNLFYVALALMGVLFIQDLWARSQAVANGKEQPTRDGRFVDRLPAPSFVPRESVSRRESVGDGRIGVHVVRHVHRSVGEALDEGELVRSPSLYLRRRLGDNDGISQ